jgi:hypothetical protein
MAESGPEGAFRVTDRRRRDEEAEPTPPSSEAVPPRPVEEAPPGPASSASPGFERPRRADRGERSLEGLFLMLGSSAVVALGEAADPMTGQMREKDPEAAADAIDLLVLLREKTEGHRTPRETRLLDELIYDLQLRYVAVSKPRL